MASSGPIKRQAQAILLCGLCDRETVKWMCIDCDTKMCENCKNIHLKVPLAAKHDVVSLATPLKDIKKKIIIDNIPCTKHPSKMTCLFCKTCEKLVCSVCVEAKHKGHDLVSMEKILEDKLGQLKHQKSKIIENLIIDCNSKTKDMNDEQNKYNSICDKSLAGIKQKEIEMTEAIREHSKHLQDQVEVERSRFEKAVCTITRQVQQVQKNLEDMRDEINDALASHQGKVIYEINLKMPKFKFDSLPNEIKRFVARPGIPEQADTYFGILQTMKTSWETSTIQFELCKTFNTDLIQISQVCVDDETSVRILDYEKRLIRDMALKQDKSVKEIPIDCRDITRLSDNNFLISTKSGVKLINKNGEVRNILTLAHLSSHGIHVRDNDIMIGVKEHGNLYTPTDKSQRAIIVSSMDGVQKQWHEYDRDGKKLFTYLYRITTNKNSGDIIVIDRIAESNGRVVCLRKDGGLKWTYDGNSLSNANIKFNPWGVVTTSAGHILVTDTYVHAVHVLSMEGDLLTFKFMSDIGITRPYSLDIDRKGQLWVGRGRDPVESARAQLHIVKVIW